MATHYLVKRGLLEQRTSPSPHVVAKCTTFKHPTANLHATLYLTSNVALPTYWNFTRYNLHSRFDRVLCEDGDFPVAANSPQGIISTVMRRALPIFPYRMTFANEAEFNKYKCMNLFRDTVESRMAFESVRRGDNPLVDPRSRRLCEALTKLANSGNVVISNEEANNNNSNTASSDNNNSSSSSSDLASVGGPMPENGGPLHVVLPWHMYHAPYIQERLLKDGWTQESVHEETLAHRAFMMKVMFGGVWATIFAVWFLSKMTVGLLFGWW